MTSKEFDIAAKLAVISRFGNAKDVNEMHTVWFARILGAMKCIIIDLNPDNSDMYEVTYNAEKDEMYVDKYEKVANVGLNRLDIDLL